MNHQGGPTRPTDSMSDTPLQSNQADNVVDGLPPSKVKFNLLYKRGTTQRQQQDEGGEDDQQRASKKSKVTKPLFEASRSGSGGDADEEDTVPVEYIQGMDTDTGMMVVKGVETSEQGSLIIPLIRYNQWTGVEGGMEKSSPQPSKLVNAIPREPKKTIIDSMPTSPLRYGLQIRSSKTSFATTGPILESKGTSDVQIKEELPLSLEEEAVQALLKGQGDVPVPILSINAVPGLKDLPSDQDKIRHDLSLRPDDMQLSDYDRVPIEAFGKALLLGMGWKEGQPVGKNQQAPVELKPVAPRPHLLGLGAAPDPATLLEMERKGLKPPKTEPAPSLSLGNQTKSSIPAVSIDDGNMQKSKSSLRVGHTVVIVEGKHKGKSGKLADLYAKSSGTAAKVELADGEILRVWGDELERKRQPWFRSGLCVYYYGPERAFYKQKGIVQDVLSKTTCLLKISSASNSLPSFLHHVQDSDCETVVPRVGESVVIVKHLADPSLVGLTAELVERDDRSERAYVRVEETFEMLRLSYDCICQCDPHRS